MSFSVLSQKWLCFSNDQNRHREERGDVATQSRPMLRRRRPGQNKCKSLFEPAHQLFVGPGYRAYRAMTTLC